MAIYNTTINVTNPANISAGENPVAIALSTNALTPQIAEAYFRIDDFPTDGFEISFSLINPVYNKKFYARDYPNSNDYFFTQVVKNNLGVVIYTGNTLQDIANSLAETLSKDDTISKIYNINYDGGVRVYLVAKEPSSKYNLADRVTVTDSSKIL